MKYTIKEVSIEELNDYAKIPIKTNVESEYKVVEKNNGLGGLKLEEVNVDSYIYDIEEDPLNWPNKFNTSNWGFFIVYDNEVPIAGMTLVYDSPEVNMLARRSDLVVLWDIRVLDMYKGKGIGRALFNTAVKWAKDRKCSQIKIETQAHNVKACKFYSKMGCHLGKIDKYVYYPDDEIQLIWFFNLIK